MMRYGGPWHTWFAWWPIWVGERLVWLRPLARRKCTDWDACPVPEDYYEYRVPSKIPTPPTEA